MFIDSHAHYDDDWFNEDRESLIADLHANGIDKIVNIGSSVKTSKTSVELAEKYDFVWAAVGVHPEDCVGMTENDLETIRTLAQNKRVVAIGEIGLDYHYADVSPKENQQLWFKKQLDLAAELDLPIVVHAREATQDTFDMIRDSKVRKGVIHAFSGSAEVATEYIKMGFYIGVGGVVTFKNGKSLVRTVENIPLEKIVIETDAPYLSPVPNRGKRNDSSNLIYTAQKIAELKGVTVEEVASVTSHNSEMLFGI
jgi:TatD DNase family protein